MVRDKVNIEIFDDRTAHIVEVFEKSNFAASCIECGSSHSCCNIKRIKH